MDPLFDFAPAELAHLRTLSPGRAISEASHARDGILDHRQLRALGLSDSAISRRVENRSLHVHHRGVYAVGRPDLTRRGRLRAALLRYGPGAALSHATAAAQIEMLSPRGRIDITVTTRPARPKRSAGVDLRYTRRWLPGEVTWVDGLPCTSVARTLADLAGSPRRRDFVRAWNHADQQLLLDVGTLGRQVARRRRGSRVLAARLTRHDSAPPTESVLEELFFDLCSAFGLPRPLCQWPLQIEDRPGRVDFVLDDRVAVEVDGRKWHAIQAAWEADHAKDLALRERGYDPHRYSYWQVKNKAPQVGSVLRAAVARSAVRR